jgi:hypothetical protein
VWGRPPALVHPPSLQRQTIESTLLCRLLILWWYKS